MHTPVFDTDGRLERVIVTRDSEWDDEQIALLLAGREQRAEIGSHGHPMDEALSPLADPNTPGGWRYEAKVRRDHAAKALATAQAERSKQYPDADLSADVWTVEKHWND